MYSKNNDIPSLLKKHLRHQYLKRTVYLNVTNFECVILSKLTYHNENYLKQKHICLKALQTYDSRLAFHITQLGSVYCT